MASTINSLTGEMVAKNYKRGARRYWRVDSDLLEVMRRKRRKHNKDSITKDVDYGRWVWLCFVKLRLATLKNQYGNSPGLGGPFWLNADQLADLLQLIWLEVSAVCIHGYLTGVVNAGYKKNHFKIPLSKYPQLADYMIELYDAGQLNHRRWRILKIRTNKVTDKIHLPEFSPVSLDHVIGRLKKLRRE